MVYAGLHAGGGCLTTPPPDVRAAESPDDPVKRLTIVDRASVGAIQDGESVY